MFEVFLESIFLFGVVFLDEDQKLLLIPASFIHKRNGPLMYWKRVK